MRVSDGGVWVSRRPPLPVERTGQVGGTSDFCAMGACYVCGFGSGRMTAFQLLLIHSLFKDFALAKSNLRDKKIGHADDSLRCSP